MLDAYRKAMIDEMAAEGFSDGKNIKIDYQNSQGDVNAAKTIADKFVAANDDLIICITTPSCIAASKATQSIPVVFGYVTDPVAAGIVKDATRAGGNVTGVTSLDSVNDQFKWMHDIDPKATKIGTVWNPGEANSKVLVDSMKKVAPTYGYTIVEATASNSNEVPPAAQSLVGKADAIFITGDNTAQAALPAIVKVGEANKLPVFTSDVHSVDQGAIATYNFFEEDLGKQTGAMAVKILKGAKPGDTPVEKPLQFKLVVNPGAAERMGITIPPDIVSKADRVVKS
ncbi:MAG: ABC transporter substrate-binding protein [Chloroflexi bacterium]|nr:ABC transporter substrate-binding protein [Chloroflexota bacterium]